MIIFHNDSSFFIGLYNYSKKQFDGFTHRFIVKFKVDEDWRNDKNITLYSNSDSYQNLEYFLNAKKSDKVVSFKIEHRESKEQDEISSKFIEELLNTDNVNTSTSDLL